MASSTNSPMASRVEASAVNSAPHACPQCSKTFSRLCDLNKHSKSHTRPYKCKDPTCKYHTLGWPTAKELERHYNDKHSANPRIFHCHFPPCPYWSKRESNCKQHMEKAHPYVYVKSKSKGRGLPTQNKAAPSNFSPGDRGTPAGMDHSSSPPSSSPLSFAMPSAGKDFVLFDDDAMGDDDDLYPGYGAAPDAETYLPWTSPTTRLRKNEEFIETFSQTYDGLQEKPSSSIITGNTEEGPVVSSFPFYGIPNHQQVEDFNQPAGEVPIKVESPVMTFDNVSPRKRKYEAVRTHQAGRDLTVSASTVGQQRGRKARAGQGASTPSGPCGGGSKHGDSGSEDDCRQKKRPKPNPIENFTDTSMPDIFRYAHPDIYDRKRTEKYAPCHTVHREISTLVRHLSRPAHRLKVTERVISSFDTVDEGFRHPRVGLCRSCWETFEDPSAFDDHVSRPCQKVSKGKREKWRILFESFTPLHDSTATGPLDSDLVRQIEEQQWEQFSSHLDGLPGPDEAKTPPTSVPSPVASQERFISAYEHDKLQREHQALRERHQQLERMTQALLIQRLMQQHTQHATAPEPDVKPLVPDSSKDHRSSNSPATSSDRDSLVQHMNSQSTDVDVYGFMQEMEDTRQTLSRMNSGLSTASRSTIHHVPPSPPSRPAELSRTRNGGLNNNQQVKHPHPHREPLPSIPDSGYGTEQRRGSLGDLPTGKGQAAMTTTRPPTPPSTAEAAQTAMTAGGETLSWEEATVTPRDNTSSPPHSQPGFLTEQELADYHDDSYNLFFQDNMLQSRSSPLGFTFEFHSQVE